MPGGSKKGGGLEVGSAYKMKNKTLSAGTKGSPMQSNYSGKSPVKLKFLKYLWRDIKGAGKNLLLGGRGGNRGAGNPFFPKGGLNMGKNAGRKLPPIKPHSRYKSK